MVLSDLANFLIITRFVDFVSAKHGPKFLELHTHLVLDNILTTYTQT